MEKSNNSISHKKQVESKIEQAIACALFYTDLKRMDYDILLMEYCWRYAAEFGSDSLVLSDTFWLWFRNQFFIKTIAFSSQLQGVNPDHLKQADLKAAFMRMHRVDANEFYPQNSLHNIITREVYMELQKLKGGTLC